MNSGRMEKKTKQPYSRIGGSLYYEDDDYKLDILPNLLKSKSTKDGRKNTKEITENTQREDSFSEAKKWAFCQVCKLGLGRDQIIEALKYIEGLPSNLEKEQTLQQTVDHVVKPIPKIRPIVVLNPITMFLNDKCRVLEDVISKDEEQEGPSCGICYDNIDENQAKQPLSCNHAFCHTCYVNYLIEKTSTNQVLDIRCPDDSCTNTFTDDHIKELLPEPKYQDYMKFKANKLLNQDLNVRWCIRPGCGKHIKGEEGCEKVVCECGTQICFVCRNEYHPGKSCEEALDKTYKEYLKKYDVQKCPQCKSGVEKSDGCNHMTCCVCHYQWCWLCGGKYSRNHYSKMNPFGCASLQSGTNTRSHWPCWRIYIWRFIRLLPWLLVLPFLPIVGFVLLLNKLFTDNRCPCSCSCSCLSFSRSSEDR